MTDVKSKNPIMSNALEQGRGTQQWLGDTADVRNKMRAESRKPESRKPENGNIDALDDDKSDKNTARAKAKAGASASILPSDDANETPKTEAALQAASDLIVRLRDEKLPNR